MTIMNCICGFKGKIEVFKGSYCDADHSPERGVVPTQCLNWRVQKIHCPFCGKLTHWFGRDIEEVYMPDNYKDLIHMQTNVWGIQENEL